MPLATPASLYHPSREWRGRINTTMTEKYRVPPDQVEGPHTRGVTIPTAGDHGRVFGVGIDPDFDIEIGPDEDESLLSPPASPTTTEAHQSTSTTRQGNPGGDIHANDLEDDPNRRGRRGEAGPRPIEGLQK